MRKHLPTVLEHGQPISGQVIRLEELKTPKQFIAAYPNVFPSLGSLQWLMRFRESNGLLKAGAVIERRTRPGATRCRILISPPHLVEWAQGRFSRDV